MPVEGLDITGSVEAIRSSSASLWGKVGTDGWTPLYIHMLDTAAVCAYLWDNWVPTHVRRRIADGISVDGCRFDEGTARSVMIFISCAHDLGKATPVFQARPLREGVREKVLSALDSAGIPYRTDLNDFDAVPHSTASQILLEEAKFHRSLAIIAGGHHGSTPDKGEVRRIALTYGHYIGKERQWKDVQAELIDMCIRASGMGPDIMRRGSADVEAQALATALVVVADWLSSNDVLFPLFPWGSGAPEFSEDRVSSAIGRIRFPSVWENDGPLPDPHDLFVDRFGFEPRPFQSSLMEVASRVSEPGIIIVEAPMGEGKTEAALAAAEILDRRFGLGGLMFALPTQATADGLFPRVRGWIGEVSKEQATARTVFLAHGKSRFNQDYGSLGHVGFGSADGSGAVVHEWFTGKRKGILSDFVIGTVDQVLMAGLKQRHLEMRHLGLAGKVVIIDECHAYDAYMGSYLSAALKWLGGYGVPVILLSATLPPSLRAELVSAYTGTDCTGGMPGPSDAFPLITYSDGAEIRFEAPAPSGRRNKVRIERVSDCELVDMVAGLHENGGYVGIVVNTVARAQRFYAEISARLPDVDVRLLHSRFTAMDRSERESDVLRALGPGARKAPPHMMVVVGTQVMEQSMDLDFDVLFTDLCPMDLLLQRMGRLHRHGNIRPIGLEEPMCFVIDTGTSELEKGSEAVYGGLHLINTRLLLGDSVSIPEDIPRLVRDAYSDGGLPVPEDLADLYSSCRREEERRIEDKRMRAKAFQVREPKGMKDLTGWLKNSAMDDPAGTKAASTVRDGDGSVEAVLVMRGRDGSFSLLPWAAPEGGRLIPADSVPDDETAFSMAGCKVQLPRALYGRGGIDSLVDALTVDNRKAIPKAWHDSEWLNGELFLVLDEDMTATVAGRKVAYDAEQGMRTIG